MTSNPIILSISIPSSKKDLWLNLNSDKSIISWHNTICERRKIKKNKTNKKGNNKRKGNMFLISNQENGYENKGWRQMFFDFCEKNYDSEDKLYRKLDIFSFFK